MSAHKELANLTPPALVWRNAGEPPHRYAEETYHGVCATCAAPCDVGVSTEQINNPTFANHAEFFKFGTHVCKACAWLYEDPKRTHRNMLAIGDELWWPMISVESATEERPSWLDLLGRIADDPERYSDGTLLCGVLTTDPKPRLWPRMRLSTVGDMGLYVHAPDYDASDYRTFGLLPVLAASQSIRAALRLGFSKKRIHTGLLSDYQRVKKNFKEVMELEEILREIRSTPEFVPALLISGACLAGRQVTKKEEEDGGRNTERPELSGAESGRAGQGDHRLF